MLAAFARPGSLLVRLMAGTGRRSLDLVLPPTCLACRRPVGEQGGLCQACWNKMGFIERPYCERLGTPFPHDPGGPLLSASALADPPAYDRARAVSRFGDVARELVHLLKYGDRLDVARPLGRWMARAMRWCRCRCIGRGCGGGDSISRPRSPAPSRRFLAFRLRNTSSIAVMRPRPRSARPAKNARAMFRALSASRRTCAPRSKVAASYLSMM